MDKLPCINCISLPICVNIYIKYSGDYHKCQMSIDYRHHFLLVLKNKCSLIKPYCETIPYRTYAGDFFFDIVHNTPMGMKWD